MLTLDVWEKINELIYQIYMSKDNVEMRITFLEKIGELIPHRISFFDLWSEINGKNRFFNPVSLTMSDSLLDDYYENYEKLDYATVIAGNMKQSVVFRNNDLLTDYVKSQSVLYTYWFPSLNSEYICASFIRFNDIPYGSVCFGRSSSDGNFTDLELEILNTLTNHLALKFYQTAPAGINNNYNNDNFSELCAKYMLSKREAEIAMLLFEGRSTANVSEILYIANGTARKHISNLYKKLNISNRTQLITKLSKIDLTY